MPAATAGLTGGLAAIALLAQPAAALAARRWAGRHGNQHGNRHSDRHSDRHGNRHGNRHGDRHGDRHGADRLLAPDETWHRVPGTGGGGRGAQ